MKRRFRSVLCNLMLVVSLVTGIADARARDDTLKEFGVKEYTLEHAIIEAQSNDPWLEGSRLKEESLAALSVSAGSLPDPTVSIALANMPIDTFDFSQEPMTQVKMGINQMFPRGKTLSLRREKFEELSQMHPLMRKDRLAKTAVVVTHIWSEIYRSKKTIRLIERDRGLFDHLVDVAQSSYTTASGRTRQQDLVRAQLELTRLEDRLTQLHQMQDNQIARLGEWLPGDVGKIDIVTPSVLSAEIDFSEVISLIGSDQKDIVSLLMTHPRIQAIDQKVRAEESSVNLAKQSYKPQWGVSASYGRRDDDPFGNQRADFMSVGVSLDVPLFTGKRQDKQVKAAVAQKESTKTERLLALRALRSGFDRAQATYSRLLERKALFDTTLLKQMSEQAEASLSAYTNDDGDFAEVVRARISELNARIEALHIDVDMQKTLSQLNYFLIGEHTQKVQTSAGERK